MKTSFASKAGAVLLAGAALTGCGPRQLQTEVGFQTTGWGKEINVSTEAGKKCYFGCSLGENWLFLSTGEYPLHINATLPGQSTAAANPDQPHDSTASGVVKTKEGLPLQGALTIWVQFQDVNAHKAEIENLYRTFPPNDLNSEEYTQKIMTRLAQHALSSVQQAYLQVDVTEVSTKTEGENGISNNIQKNVTAAFKEQGFGVVKVKSVVLSGINLGPAAEQANQQIGLAQVQMTVAEKQTAAAEKLSEAQDVLAPITDKLVKNFIANGADPKTIPSLVCLHEKMNSEDFSRRHPQGCFPAMDFSLK